MPIATRPSGLIRKSLNWLRFSGSTARPDSRSVPGAAVSSRRSDEGGAAGEKPSQLTASVRLPASQLTGPMEAPEYCGGIVHRRSAPVAMDATMRFWTSPVLPC